MPRISRRSFLRSVGLAAAYHHLWEHGTTHMFCTIGRVKPGPDGRRRVTLKYTFDERVEDGLYCAAGLNLFAELLRKPAKLL